MDSGRWWKWQLILSRNPEIYGFTQLFRGWFEEWFESHFGAHQDLLRFPKFDGWPYWTECTRSFDIIQNHKHSHWKRMRINDWWRTSAVPHSLDIPIDSRLITMSSLRRITQRIRKRHNNKDGEWQCTERVDGDEIEFKGRSAKRRWNVLWICTLFLDQYRSLCLLHLISIIIPIVEIQWYR